MDYSGGPTWGFMIPSLWNDLMTLIQQAFSHGYVHCSAKYCVVWIIEETINSNIWKVINWKTGTQWAYLYKLSTITLCPVPRQVSKVITPCSDDSYLCACPSKTQNLPGLETSGSAVTVWIFNTLHIHSFC